MEEIQEQPIQEQNWYDEEKQGDESEDGYIFKEYDVTSTPNDFNLKTMIDFMESGIFNIPGFQRNYVWDIKRASKLIESFIIGLPIPQIFLYEEERNKYLVIDGQQRLLSIYFFSKGRFPKKEKRMELRKVFEEFGKYPDEYLNDNDYFDDFKLKLNAYAGTEKNKLHGLSYASLADLKNTFDLRTIRNVMIKQNSPDDGDSAMYEIFNRLNSGGVILTPQEIRISLYHSKFYEMLYELNLNEKWRTLLNKKEPDIHMKDVEILIRGFAMLLRNDIYKPSMTRFINQFSKEAKKFSKESILLLRDLFITFCDSIIKLDDKIFISRSGKFSITIFESIFVALSKNPIESQQIEINDTTIEKLTTLKTNPTFIDATQWSTASKKSVEERLRIARETLL
jgi:uncharacterized protein with ParB-like and HNH nuclease domain